MVSSRRGFLSADLNLTIAVAQERIEEHQQPNRPRTTFQLKRTNCPTRISSFRDERRRVTLCERAQRSTEVTIDGIRREKGMRGAFLTYPGSYAKEGAPYDKIAAHVSESKIHATQKNAVDSSALSFLFSTVLYCDCINPILLSEEGPPCLCLFWAALEFCF